MGQEGPTDLIATASRRKSCAGCDGKSGAYHRRGRGRGYICSPRPSLFWTTFYCSGQPYIKATCFQPDEPKDNTVRQYITRIKTQAQFCSFADCTDQIRDQILQTMMDGKLRESLLEIGDITWDVCLQKARQKDIAQVQARSMQPFEGPAASSSPLHRLYQTQKSVAGSGGDEISGGESWRIMPLLWLRSWTARGKV